MPVQSSQDLDARFAVFLNPIRDLTKNWEVDIATYLEEYLVELSEIQITFDGGETTMNFAEAAMLIQGSATVYSKKVEFLWQMVLQMLDLLSSKRTLESRADNTKAGECGKNKQTDSYLEFKKIDKLCDGKTINMKDDDDDEEEEMQSSFKFLPEMPLHLVEKESEKSLMKIVLYLKNMETFGNKDDFRINRSYLTPSGLLYLDLPPEILKKRMHTKNVIEPSADDSIAGFLNNEDENIEAQNERNGLQENLVSFSENVPDPALVEAEDNSDVMEPDFDPPSSPEIILNNEQLNFDADIMPVVNGEIEIPSETVDVISTGKYGLRSRNAHKEIVTKVKLSLPLKPLDPHVETPAKRPIRAGRIRKPLPCLCHREHKVKRRRRKSRDDDTPDLTSLALPSVESFITKELADIISHNNNNIKEKLLDFRLLEEITNEETKRLDELKNKKVKELMVCDQKLTEKEIEERISEETQQLNKLAAKAADEAYDNHIPDIDLDDFHCDDEDLAMPNPHEDNAYGDFNRLVDDDQQRFLNDSAMYEPGSDYEALVQKWVSDYVTSAQEHIASSELTRRVNKWRKIITPKLQEEEDRQSFDIHSYGSHILGHFPEESSSDTILFDEVARNENPNEVSRIFLSCLMLANTYNIELKQTREGDLEMDCLQLKLLSTVRHHKEMEDYLPPSVKKKKSKQDKRKKQVSSDDEQVSINSASSDEERGNPFINKNKKSNSKKLKITENYSNR